MSVRPAPTAVRESTILSWDTQVKRHVRHTASGESTVHARYVRRQRYVRHAASGNRTLCGIALGGSIPDPPGYRPAEPHCCQHRVCRDALAALNIGAPS